MLFFRQGSPHITFGKMLWMALYPAYAQGFVQSLLINSPPTVNFIPITYLLMSLGKLTSMNLSLSYAIWRKSFSLQKRLAFVLFSYKK